MNFFEENIRPVLVEHCQECHSAETEASGGLLLDSRPGWKRGGDSGAAIMPGDVDASLLIKAISYDDPDLQMPPDGRLPTRLVAAFETWIAAGAIDPRSEGPPEVRVSSGLTVEQAQEHWAYRPRIRPEVPTVNSSAARSAVDRFIDEKLQGMGMVAAEKAPRSVIVRRMYFDLIGLPPPPDAEQRWFQPDDASDEVGYRRLVDGLLNSPQYGEHFARKWMDVARYAESITLRGFVLPEAWRYRDYLVQAFAEDRPFNQMVREQLAGDLLQHDDLRERQMQLVATSFLAMGNNNLEQQDKKQLEMDYLDEQLETIGRAFLGQTLGCARCHDHKFDPIPTKDYYALAGIFRSAVALEHANLSMWIEQPLPVPKDQEPEYQEATEELTTLTARIEAIKKETSLDLSNKPRAVPVSELAGIVVDDTEAKLVGYWKSSASTGRSVGVGYLHEDNANKGMATATFEPTDLPPGQYQVRMAYSASNNRASNVLVNVFSGDGEAQIQINQRETPPEDGLWISLGSYRFEPNGQAFVLIANDGTDGHVIVDAIQFLPVSDPEQSSPVPVSPEARQELAQQAEERKELTKELAMLEGKKKKLEAKLSQRPRYLTIVEKLPPTDIPIHIRGDVHNLGEVVPRGFLTALPMPAESTRISPNSSGRIELANWVSSDLNPLTARVYANRVWCWLMGQGIVSSVNNFGTTGTAPIHPELLEWLASELVDSGWSTKHLVKTIVLSDAYQRAIISADEKHNQLDPSNQFYWRGWSRRITAEAMRDAMLQISGELDLTVGGTTMRGGVKADYDYPHQTTRRTIYHPVFRNSLPELLETFDFADTSVSIGQRARSTVATQPLVLMNHPWVSARAQAAVARFESSDWPPSGQLIDQLYRACYYRSANDQELNACLEFLTTGAPSERTQRLQLLIHSLFAALDFRYLE
jgi:hypothetical protein